MSWLRRATTYTEQQIWDDIKTENPTFQEKMIARFIKDELVLSRIVLEATDWRIRRDALSYIQDTNILNDLLMDLSSHTNFSNQDLEIMERVKDRLDGRLGKI